MNDEKPNLSPYEIVIYDHKIKRELKQTELAYSVEDAFQRWLAKVEARQQNSSQYELRGGKRTVYYD